MRIMEVQIAIVNAFNICVLTFYSCCRLNMDFTTASAIFVSADISSEKEQFLIGRGYYIPEDAFDNWGINIQEKSIGFDS